MSFYTVDRETFALYEIKKSSFHAYLIPSSDFENVRDRLRIEHTKSRHIVWAKRELNKFDQIVENCSDDGEPKGTSGPPSLNVLRGSNLINTAVLIVRYFGGIKLGTGGLVRAYSSACNEVISISNLISYESLKTYTINAVFSQIQKVEYLLDMMDLDIKIREFGIDGASMVVDVPSSKQDKFVDSFENLSYEGVSIL
jgi:uncharacterized YigZ family protein